MRNKTRILITGSQASMWYNTMVGETITVTNTPPQTEYYHEKGNRIVFKCDAKLIDT